MKLLIGFRKFTYGFIFLSVSLLLLLGGHISGAHWIEYNRDVAVAFMATNISEHIINVAKTWVNDKLLKKLT